MPVATWRWRVLFVLICGFFTSLSSMLKGWSLTYGEIDVSACMQNIEYCDPEAYRDLPVVYGATCRPALQLMCPNCPGKFRLCRGGYIYEAVSVTILEAMLTIAVGLTAVIVMTPDVARQQLLDTTALKAVAPVGALYALNDVFDVMIYTKVNVAQASVVSQCQLLLSAVLRLGWLKQNQTLRQWFFLCAITSLSIGFIAQGTSAFSLEEMHGTAGVLLKSFMRCTAAVYTELALVRMQKLPLWVNQVHFKSCTLCATMLLSLWRGNFPRLFASAWMHEHTVPTEMSIGDPRTPFFGGWSWSTVALTVFLVANNFVIGFVLKRISATMKYVGYASALTITYALTVLTRQGGAEFHAGQCIVCLLLMAVVFLYSVAPVWVPPAPKEAEEVYGGRRISDPVGELVRKLGSTKEKTT